MSKYSLSCKKLACACVKDCVAYMSVCDPVHICMNGYKGHNPRYTMYDHHRNQELKCLV